MKLILGLGSNLNQPVENLKKAILKISGYFRIVKVSSCYKTKSLLKDNQPDYFNAIILIETNKNLNEIVNIVRKVESSMGKKKEYFWGPRVIDIDIIDYGGKIINSNDLTIPHKEMHNRSFVLYPLKEVMDNYVHPIYNKDVNELILLLDEDFEIIKTGEKLWQ
jgi:2-amino-4-hydroxy-6-hydroxymethyldihydropteridine diphosphokinase